MSTYPRRPKAEVFDNVVDVVNLLLPTNQARERTAPPSSAHVQLDDVPQTLDQEKCRGRVLSARRYGDSVDDVTRAGLCLSTTML